MHGTFWPERKLATNYACSHCEHAFDQEYEGSLSLDVQWEVRGGTS